MNSNIITFDYQSGQIRRDLARETANRRVEIYVPAKAEPISTPNSRFGKWITFGKTLFVNRKAAVNLQ